MGDGEEAALGGGAGDEDGDAVQRVGDVDKVAAGQAEGGVDTDSAQIVELPRRVMARFGREVVPLAHGHFPNPCVGPDGGPRLGGATLAGLRGE